jgi:hypothetical protein
MDSKKIQDIKWETIIDENSEEEALNLSIVVKEENGEYLKILDSGILDNELCQYIVGLHNTRMARKIDW